MGISKYIYAEESSKNRIRRLMKTKILLAKGYGIDEIAVHLGVSANVVRGYIRECGHITLEEAEKYFHNSLLGGIMWGIFIFPLSFGLFLFAFFNFLGLYFIHLYVLCFMSIFLVFYKIKHKDFINPRFADYLVLADLIAVIMLFIPLIWSVFLFLGSFIK